MRRGSVFLALAWALFAAPLGAQTVVTSERPDGVAVTVYRNPEREPGQVPNLRWLGGYALITETRTLEIPAGESVVRFEGVASGLMAETAIVTGFPEGIVERNRDADLLSPAALLDRSLARRVHLRRTSSATGAVREQDAIIRSGADGAVIVQTAEGFEALRCTGLPETIVYDGVPSGLNARPTMSVRLWASAPSRATFTLSYLAGGFDWQANYLGSLSPDGRRLDLFAWLTLASMDDTSFPDADTQAVAGQPNREEREWEPIEADELRLRCWPQGRTHEIRPGGARYGDESDEAIVVTGSLIRGPDMRALAPVTTVTAEQEDLGDLKLYRIPVPVTVAARSQKQVALLRRESVRVSQRYRQRVDAGQADEEPIPAQWQLLTRNRDAEGLGLPLPAGRLVLFGQGSARPIMLGASAVRDLSVGEEVELTFAAIGVMTELRRIDRRDGRSSYALIVSNDHGRRIPFEAELDFQILDSSRRLRRDGDRPVWRVTLPANGRAELRFTATD